MSTPTQTRHPWRATIRTAVAVVTALAAMLPFLVAASGVDETLAPVAGVLAIAAAITKVMALPQVGEFLARFVPWLAAAPADETGDPLTYAYVEPTLDELQAENSWTASEPTANRRIFSCAKDTACTDDACPVHTVREGRA